MGLTKIMHIDICVCTFRRASIIETLRSLDTQIVPDGVSLAVIVADNDDTPSAREQVEAVSAELSLPIAYVHAPARNISIARNACLENASGDWIAFLDDDETAAPDWIAELCAVAMSTNCDVVFGPALAVYGEDTPDWIRRYDYHSNRPRQRGGVVQTGFTCNALIRRTAAVFERQDFLLEKGRTGGEDTEFFYRAWIKGARYCIAEKAIVYDVVEPNRLSFNWIMTRKFHYGVSYGHHCLPRRTLIARARFAALSGAKSVFCGLIGCFTLPFASRRNYWLLRAGFHAGAVKGALNGKASELYGS